MTDAAIAGLFEAKKHAYRQTQDGVVVSFVIHPDDVDSAFAVAPLGTPFQLAYKSLDYDEPSQIIETPRDNVPMDWPKPQGTKQDKRAWSDLTPREQACIRCGDPAFRAWLANIGACNWFAGVTPNEEGAAAYVRHYCGVDSRSELDNIAHPLNPGGKWAELDQRYLEDTRLPEQRT